MTVRTVSNTLHAQRHSVATFGSLNKHDGLLRKSRASRHNTPPYGFRVQQRVLRQFFPTTSISQEPVMEQECHFSHRHWVSKDGAPVQDNSAHKFTLMSYNILANAYAHHHTNKLYPEVPKTCLTWQHRYRLLINEILHWKPSVLCLQEVDCFRDIEAGLEQAGYKGLYMRRPGWRKDGCATFWLSQEFDFVDSCHLPFNYHHLEDNVALIISLTPKPKPTSTTPTSTPTTHSHTHSPARTNLPTIVIANTHLVFDPAKGDSKLAQMRLLIQQTVSVANNVGPRGTTSTHHPHTHTHPHADPPTHTHKQHDGKAPKPAVPSDDGITVNFSPGLPSDDGVTVKFPPILPSDDGVTVKFPPVPTFPKGHSVQDALIRPVRPAVVLPQHGQHDQGTPQHGQAAPERAQHDHAVPQHGQEASRGAKHGQEAPERAQHDHVVPQHGQEIPQHAHVESQEEQHGQTEPQHAQHDQPAPQHAHRTHAALAAATTAQHMSQRVVSTTAKPTSSHTHSLPQTSSSPTSSLSPQFSLPTSPSTPTHTPARVHDENVYVCACPTTTEAGSHNGAPIIIAGDFNALPNSGLHEFMALGGVDLARHSRKMVSGQLGRPGLSYYSKLLKQMHVVQRHQKWQEQGGRKEEDAGRKSEDGGRESEDFRRKSEDDDRKSEVRERILEEDGRKAQEAGRMERVSTLTGLLMKVEERAQAAPSEPCLTSWQPKHITRITSMTPNRLPRSPSSIIIKHGVNLQSAYEQVTGLEPLYTSYHSEFLGTVDYIWYSDGGREENGGVKLVPTRVLSVPDPACFPRGMPSQGWGSDHISLMTEFAIVSESMNSS